MAERLPFGPSTARSLPFASNSSIFAYGALLGCLFLPSQTTTLSASLPSAIASSHPETHHLSFLSGCFLYQMLRFQGSVLADSRDGAVE